MVFKNLDGGRKYSDVCEISIVEEKNIIINYGKQVCDNGMIKNQTLFFKKMCFLFANFVNFIFVSSYIKYKNSWMTKLVILNLNILTTVGNNSILHNVILWK